MSSKKLINRKLFNLNPDRLKEIFSILEWLSNDWLCNFKNASWFWITYDEWNKTQHYFLWWSSVNKEKIEELIETPKLF